MNRFKCLQRKTMTDEQFRDSEMPMGNEVLMDSNPERNQKIGFKSTMMVNLSQRETGKNIQISEPIPPFTKESLGARAKQKKPTELALLKYSSNFQSKLQVTSRFQKNL